MRVLINRTDAIGDTILTIPMAKAIKTQHPDAYIAFLITKPSLALFEKESSVNEVIVLDRKRSKLSQYLLVRKIFKKKKYDVYIYVGGTHLPSFAAIFAGIRVRCGLKSRWPSFLTLNSGVRQRRSSVETHEFHYNLSLLKPLGIDLGLEERAQFYPEIKLTDYEIGVAQAALKKDLMLTRNSSQVANYIDDGNYIIIHPGMTGHTLNLPISDYVRVMFKIAGSFKHRYLFLISYTSSDKKQIDAFKSEVEQLLVDDDQEFDSKYRPDIYYFDGGLRGLRDYMGVVSGTKLFIGPSTGPLHIANSLRKKILGIYSPILVQSSSRWGPIPREEERVKIAVPNVVCGEQKNCMGSDCPYYECMERVGVDHLVAEATELLKSNY
jgi:ADP-heptose:LPS heptosyltransferase